MITCSDPKHALNLVRQCSHKMDQWAFWFGLVALLFSFFIGLGWAFFLLYLSSPPPSLFFSPLSSLLPVRLPLTSTLNIKLSLYGLVFQFCFSFKSFENNIGVFIVIFCALISKFLHQRFWKDGTKSPELHLSWRRIIWKVWIFERTIAVVTFIKNYLLK